jgi:hypothetical protein
MEDTSKLKRTLLIGLLLVITIGFLVFWYVRAHSLWRSEEQSSPTKKVEVQKTQPESMTQQSNEELRKEIEALKTPSVPPPVDQAVQAELENLKPPAQTSQHSAQEIDQQLDQLKTLK